MKKFNGCKYFTILLMISFSIFTISCINTVTPTTLAETKISETTVVSTTTIAETSTAVEQTTTTEAEIVNTTAIEGLVFNSATKEYVAEAGNPYGLKEGIVAGVSYQMETEINGKKQEEVLLGLNPKVVDYYREKLWKEKNDNFFPLIVDPREGSKLEINEFTDTGTKMNTLGICLSDGARFFAPLSGPCSVDIVDVHVNLIFDFDINEKNRIGYIDVYCLKENLILDMNGASVDDAGDGQKISSKKFNLKEGDPIVQIVNNKITTHESDKNFINNGNGNYQILVGIYGKDKENTGLSQILEIDGKRVFVLPNETAAHDQSQ